MDCVLFSLLWLSLDCTALLRVGLDVEIGEQGEEEGSKEEEECHKHLWVVTLHEEWEAGMDGPGDKLDKLHAGDVPEGDGMKL